MRICAYVKTININMLICSYDKTGYPYMQGYPFYRTFNSAPSDGSLFLRERNRRERFDAKSHNILNVEIEYPVNVL